jgi:hypothetical protein
MSLQELIAVMPPPARPIETGSLDAKAFAEQALSIRLPKEVFEFGQTYGSGSFGTATVLNPFSERYLGCVHEVSSCYQGLRISEGEEFIPYPVFPEKPRATRVGR